MTRMRSIFLQKMSNYRDSRYDQSSYKRQEDDKRSHRPSEKRHGTEEDGSRDYKRSRKESSDHRPAESLRHRLPEKVSRHGSHSLDSHRPSRDAMDVDTRKTVVKSASIDFNRLSEPLQYLYKSQKSEPVCLVTQTRIVTVCVGIKTIARTGRSAVFKY